MQATPTARRNQAVPDESLNQQDLPHLRRFDETLNSLPQLDLNAGRQAVLEYFDNTWNLTEMLFSSLTSREAFYVRPYHKTRHPLVFYYAHPACLYVNKMLVSGLISEPVNKEFELLFETGVDEMNWDDLHEGDKDVWPPLEDVLDYRRQVYELVRKVIQTHPCLNEPVTMDSQAWALVMGFEHERIHLETSSVLMRELPISYVTTPPGWPPLLALRRDTAQHPVPGVDYPADNPMLEVMPATIELGKPRGWPTFGWDNEYGHDKRQVSSFSASSYLISNGEFYRFVAEGGYETRKYWSESGWGWRTFRNVKWPTFWVQDGPAGSHRYRLRSTFAVVDMQWNWPAVVNYFEARAYCAWLTDRTGVDVPFRLLQEAEHLAIRDPSQRQAGNWVPGKDRMLGLDPVRSRERQRSYNMNLQHGAETPVDALPPDSLGFHDTLGNVWQWCEDAFHPLQDFEIHPFYTDFSTPCFDGEHQMILGGSFISTGDEASIWSRFHFRPHFFQHAGFRVVQSREDPEESSNKYESTRTVDQYLLFHYGSAAEQRDEVIASRAGHPDTGNFVVHTAALMRRYARGKRAALDLGCAVGRASFELSRGFESVTGLDYSTAFIAAANRLKQLGELPFRRVETGRHQVELTARVPGDIDRGRVSFVEGDASNLDADLPRHLKRTYDAVLMANLLCRLSEPEACLRQFIEADTLLAAEGILVIASPNTWLEQYTPAESFLDGATSEETIAKLGSILEGFELLHAEDFPFMIREHRRKYEYIVSQITVWRKLAN